MAKKRKLKWVTDKKAHQTLLEEHSSFPGEFYIDIQHERIKNTYLYVFRLLNNGRFIGLFRKLSAAKACAQLIHNG